MTVRLRNAVDLPAHGPYYVAGCGVSCAVVRGSTGPRRPAVIAKGIPILQATRVSHELNRAWASDPNEL
jgi:hypothetical protein